MKNEKTILATIIGITLSIIFLAAFVHQPSDRVIGKWSPSPDVINMPVVQDSKPDLAYWQFAPIEQRGEEFKKFLAPSLKIRVANGSGSGTIVYYDRKDGYAYVASCGHLWNGNMSYAAGRNVTAQVITWYHNETKLPKERAYSAEVLFYSNDRGYDTSLLRFKPDWEPAYFPFASPDFKLTPGKIYHSVGCDGGREVAHYEVEFVEYRGMDAITRRNSPRPGRSGGGLMDEEKYIGTCWGTSDTVSGGGIGYFTSLTAIHKIYTQNGFEWLFDIKSNPARSIPIYDWMDPERQHDGSNIPLPDQASPIPEYVIN